MELIMAVCKRMEPFQKPLLIIWFHRLMALNHTNLKLPKIVTSQITCHNSTFKVVFSKENPEKIRFLLLRMGPTMGHWTLLMEWYSINPYRLVDKMLKCRLANHKILKTRDNNWRGRLAHHLNKSWDMSKIMQTIITIKETI